ncbi:MAG: hypothetical protein NC041_09800 [Bacteroides sp.]|nr:hypothetical protein [Prevotella sp.]MCM1408541.1 hypothetical protein [Treponema brennaborense]MCM1470745.1 hypothetical protein [Bacteroides sp.]
MKKIWYCAIALLPIWTAAASVFPFAGIPDSAEIRQELVLPWFERDIDYLRTCIPTEKTNSVLDVFQVRFEETENEFMIVVAPRQEAMLEVHSEYGTEMRTASVFRAGTPGSWVLHRSKKDGRPVCIRYYFWTTPDVYIQLRPDSAKPVADFVIYSAFAARGVPAGSDFKLFYTASLEEVFRLTEHTIPWEYVTHYRGLYTETRQMIAVIREKLSGLTEFPDAALNENGVPVHISDPKKPIAPELIEENKKPLSTAGFLKWIADGLVLPRAGNCLFIEPLKMPTFSLPVGSKAEGVSSVSNIYFALDWTRNLAAAALSVYKEKTIPYTASGVDVHIEPFSTDFSGAAGAAYMQNTGYAANFLKPLLFVLAATEPGRFYLCAVRESDGKEPESFVYNHCAALFPYITPTGQFAAIVFQSGKETDIDTFVADNAGCFMHLTRINASELFNPL